MAAGLAEGKAVEVSAYLNKIRVDDEDPALFIDWDMKALEDVVAGVNRSPELRAPWFVTSSPGRMTQDSFVRDIMAYVGRASGGVCGNVLFAPNSLVQYGQVVSLMRDLEAEPFMQHAARFLPQGKFLGTIQLLQEQTMSHATPFGWVAPRPGLRQIFG